VFLFQFATTAKLNSIARISNSLHIKGRENRIITAWGNKNVATVFQFKYINCGSILHFSSHATYKYGMRVQFLTIKTYSVFFTR